MSLLTFCVPFLLLAHAVSAFQFVTIETARVTSCQRVTGLYMASYDKFSCRRRIEREEAIRLGRLESVCLSVCCAVMHYITPCLQ